MCEIPLRLIVEAHERPQDEKPDANDRAVFASKFDGVATLARHPLSQILGRRACEQRCDVIADENAGSLSTVGHFGEATAADGRMGCLRFRPLVDRPISETTTCVSSAIKRNLAEPLGYKSYDHNRR